MVVHRPRRYFVNHYFHALTGIFLLWCWKFGSYILKLLLCLVSRNSRIWMVEKCQIGLNKTWYWNAEGNVSLWFAKSRFVRPIYIVSNLRNPQFRRPWRIKMQVSVATILGSIRSWCSRSLIGRTSFRPVYTFKHTLLCGIQKEQSFFTLRQTILLFLVL